MTKRFKSLPTRAILRVLKLLIGSTTASVEVILLDLPVIQGDHKLESSAFLPPIYNFCPLVFT